MQTMSRIVISTSTDIVISLVVSFLCNIHLNYQHISAQANMLCKNARVSPELLATVLLHPQLIN